MSGTKIADGVLACAGGGDDNPCFPSAALAQHANGSAVRVDTLKEGDEVLAVTAEGSLTTDRVSFLSLAAPEKLAGFYTLTTAAGRNVTLTPEHHIPIGEECCGVLKPAKQVKVGEMLWVASAKGKAATAQRVVHKRTTPGVGLHSPVMAHGSFPVIDGVVTAFDSITKVWVAAVANPALEQLVKATGTSDLLRRTLFPKGRRYIDGYEVAA